jgi:hypothetical protein
MMEVVGDAEFFGAKLRSLQPFESNRLTDA